MKSIGAVRKMDEQGRIVIPKSVRKRLGLFPGKLLEFFVMDDEVIIKKYKPSNSIQDKIRDLDNILSDIGTELSQENREQVEIHAEALKKLCQQRRKNMEKCEWCERGYCEVYGSAEEQEKEEINWPCNGTPEEMKDCGQL